MSRTLLFAALLLCTKSIVAQFVEITDLNLPVQIRRNSTQRFWTTPKTIKMKRSGKEYRVSEFTSWETPSPLSRCWTGRKLKKLEVIDSFFSFMCGLDVVHLFVPTIAEGDTLVSAYDRTLQADGPLLRKEDQKYYRSALFYKTEDKKCFESSFRWNQQIMVENGQLVLVTPDARKLSLCKLIYEYRAQQYNTFISINKTNSESHTEFSLCLNASGEFPLELEQLIWSKIFFLDLFARYEVKDLSPRSCLFISAPDPQDKDDPYYYLTVLSPKMDNPIEGDLRLLLIRFDQDFLNFLRRQ